MFRLGTNHFPSDVGQVGAKKFVSIGNIRRSDRAILQKIDVPGAYHPHDAACKSSTLDLFLGESFIITTNCLDRRMKREVGIIDEEVDSIWVLAKINCMQAFYCRGELDHPRFCEDHEYAPAVGTIVCDLEFLSQLLKRLNVRNPPGIKIYRCGAKIRFVSHLQCTLVAMNSNRIFGRADIVDVVGLGEQMDRRLTVKQEEV